MFLKTIRTIAISSVMYFLLEFMFAILVVLSSNTLLALPFYLLFLLSLPILFGASIRFIYERGRSVKQYLLILRSCVLKSPRIFVAVILFIVVFLLLLFMASATYLYSILFVILLLLFLIQYITYFYRVVLGDSVSSFFKVLPLQSYLTIFFSTLIYFILLALLSLLPQSTFYSIFGTLVASIILHVKISLDLIAIKH